MYQVEGKTMYRHVLEELQKAAAKMRNGRIVVVTQEKFAEIIDAAKEIGAEALINSQPERGISSSMQIGLESAKDADACLFTVSDQPWLTAETIIALYDAFQSENKGNGMHHSGRKNRKSVYFF